MPFGHLFDSYSLRSFRGLRQCPAAQEHLTRVLSAIAVRRGVTRSASALSCSSPKADRPHRPCVDVKADPDPMSEKGQKESGAGGRCGSRRLDGGTINWYKATTSRRPQTLAAQVFLGTRRRIPPFRQN